MTVLGIDTSAIVCSVSLISDGKVLAQRTVSDGLTHSETLLPSIKDVLSEGKVSLSSLDGIAISHGPGSFTGLRIGISAVKGLAVSHQIPCVGVSTLEALAMNVIREEGKLVCALMDARRGEFYNAIFRVTNGFLLRVCEDRAISGELIAKEIMPVDEVILVGDGAEKFAEQNSSFLSKLAPPEIRLQSGTSVALLGDRELKKEKGISCMNLSPRYLRLPQAEREWNKQHKNEM